MANLQQQVDAVRTRQQRQRLWQHLSWGLVLGGAAGSLAAIARLATDGGVSWSWIVLSVTAVPLAALALAVLRPVGARQAAVTIDRSCYLKDRVATALDFLGSFDRPRSSDSAFRELQIADAQQRVAEIDPAHVAPVRAPRSLMGGLTLTCLAIVFGLLSGQPEPVSANVVSNPVVGRQAVRVEDSLEELEKFNEEEADPEVEQLLKELAETIEELKEPGLDPKEALAKLSEMEAALQQQQEQLNQHNTEAALQEIGEALSLAEPFKAAGEALSHGEMEAAADELEKLDLPKLDRQTEKAVAEKLEQVEQNSSGGAKKQLRQAAGKISQGLSSGDRSKFKDGMQGLAGECKKQGRRKKLSDLLRKQCQCLGECKSECEGQCKNNATSPKKGGKNWGLAASGNQPGDKTAKLGLGPQMQLTGQESEQGDVDVETTASSEQQQEALRNYRQNAEKYKQLSESVLSSEPIPLGHRQTIRRYFEMIRPQAGEVDAVGNAADEKAKHRRDRSPGSN